MNIKIIKNSILLEDVKKMAEESFGEMVKAVVDLEKKVFALGGEFHADAEALLLEYGSQQKNLWGINIYPSRERKDWIEFISLINIRPREENNGMEIQNKTICEEIRLIIEAMVMEQHV